MAVNALSSSDTTSYVRDTSSDNSNSVVDTDMFLRLLVAQLKYQDPLEPQKDTAFVTQMAQMTTLQEMQQMNSTLMSSQAYDMVGKQVYARVLNPNTGETMEYFGTVDSIIIDKGVPYVVVGNTIISISDVIQVFPEPIPEENEDTKDTGETEEPADTDG